MKFPHIKRYPCCLHDNYQYQHVDIVTLLHVNYMIYAVVSLSIKVDWSFNKLESRFRQNRMADVSPKITGRNIQYCCSEIPSPLGLTRLRYTNNAIYQTGQIICICSGHTWDISHSYGENDQTYSAGKRLIKINFPPLIPE